MKVTIRLILLWLINIPVFANDDFSSGKLIGVRWTLHSNFDTSSDHFKASFVLVNRSNFQLTAHNWCLYFNAAPRTIINDEESKANIEHLNGDWFRLKPLDGFLLSPGDSVTVSYQGYPAMIKHNDSPAGLYFVFFNDQGKEQLVTPVMDYRYDSFVNSTQINRSAHDLEPIPTPEWLYFNNLSLSRLPAKALRETIPTPVNIVRSNDSTFITSEFEIVYQQDLKNEAIYLKEIINNLLGWNLALKNGSECKRCLLLKLNPQAKTKDESYELTVSKDKIEIHADSSAGIFYGIQTLVSYIPLSHINTSRKSFRLPERVIHDAPRFEYRGLALDVARNFQSKETVLKLIDLLAYYKINRLLLIMADDEGWRIEIDGLPELTHTGAQRQHSTDFREPVLHPSYGSGPYFNSNHNYGSGFYSKSDFIQILQFAKSRHIKVIPEFNLPAHAKAAIKAMEARYNRLASEGKMDEANEFRLLDPLDTSRYISAQGYKDNTTNVAGKSTFRFAYKVVTEIEKLYKEAGMHLDEIHLGGDEVPRGVWTGSPMARNLVGKEPEVESVNDLQPYYFRQLLEILSKKNLQIDIWDDMLLIKNSDGTVSIDERFRNEKVLPFIWNNIFDNPDLAYRLANAGYKTILCNVSNFYFDLAYNKDPREPGAYWGGFVDAKDAWALAPFDMFKTTFNTPMGKKLTAVDFTRYERLTNAAKRNIVGVQAQVFSETIKGREMLEYYLLPKLIGFAETAWAKEREWETIENDSARMDAMNTDWNSFANALAIRELPRLKLLHEGFNYRVPPPGAIIEDGLLKANSEYPGLKIFYMDQAREPREFKEYTVPTSVNGKVILKCADASGGESRLIELSHH